ncbi:hypothetical protein [Ramlibacter sp.]|uniref:hypothetical protein n=1 Tax=Ramlibacter sp. TaxID=1917967 RepID=UPI0026204A28|nr:hypothetical protein [Ramlibacter sp.]MDB5957917.1 hypothetical protein [Ramlibacter sp.]
MLSLTFVSLRRLLGGSAQQAGASSFQATRPAPARLRGAGADLIFRLKAWPELGDTERTAEIYRILSVMSSQPVNRQWLAARCTMPAQDLDKLLRQLVAQGALEVIDPARFAGREPLQA